MDIRPINEKDQNIFNAIPKSAKNILEVGAGDCVICYYMSKDGYNVTATDIYTDEKIKEYPKDSFEFYEASIFNKNDFKQKYEVVICSQVLEHLKDYKEAFKNLINLTSNTLIITFPWKKSFNHPEHINYWDDSANGEFKNINEFRELAKPYRIDIAKIYTKQRDRQTKSMNYLLKVTK